MTNIGFKITGELENLGAMILGTELYPQGQNCRGAFGYIFLDMGLERLSKSYQNANPVLYFRDCLVKCNNGDGGNMLPLVRQDAIGGRIIKETIYRCSKCGYIVKELDLMTKDQAILTHMNPDGSANSFVENIVDNRNRSKFKLDIVLKGGKNKDVETDLAELLTAIKFVESSGIYFGKRKNKGYGKMILKNTKVVGIDMKNIAKRGEEIENTVKKTNGILTINLISDYIGKTPISGDDLLRDIKNAVKFFDPDWAEYRDSWKDPQIFGTGKSIELDTDARKNVSFLDCKVDVNRIDETMKFDKADRVISKGTIFNYKVDGFDKLDSTFWNAIAMAEMLRGLGERTSFGKGQFIVS